MPKVFDASQVMLDLAISQEEVQILQHLPPSVKEILGKKALVMVMLRYTEKQQAPGLREHLLSVLCSQDSTGLSSCQQNSHPSSLPTAGLGTCAYLSFMTVNHWQLHLSVLIQSLAQCWWRMNEGMHELSELNICMYE